MPPQLEKNHVVPTSWQDEALVRDGVSREVPCSALKGETVPDNLRVHEAGSIPGDSEDPSLEKGTATHSSILACRIPWTEEPGGLQSMGSLL